MTLHEQYRSHTVDQLLQALEADAEPGSPHREYLESLLSARTAEAVNKQLAETASSIGRSANLLKSSLENSSEWLINAIKVGTEASRSNAQQVGGEIARLTAALATASTEIQSAGNQSTALGRRLNWLTAILTLAALVSAGATAFSAFETKRQIDLMERQLQRSQTVPQQGPKTAVPPIQH